jgi:hypothetical protein
MAGMYDLKTCPACKIGKLIPTGNTLDEFKCDNPNCNQRLIDKNIFETINSGDHVDIIHYREETGE